jgi:hypothetical protein
MIAFYNPKLRAKTYPGNDMNHMPAVHFKYFETITLQQN